MGSVGTSYHVVTELIRQGASDEIRSTLAPPDAPETCPTVHWDGVLTGPNDRLALPQLLREAHAKRGWVMSPSAAQSLENHVLDQAELRAAQIVRDAIAAASATTVVKA